MRDDVERLRDILKAIDHILDKTSGGRSAFDDDEMLRVWVLHHLQIIGEAARSLSSEFRQRHPDKVWVKAAGMRNILVHHYFEINAARIWNVLECSRRRLTVTSRSRPSTSWRTAVGPALS